MRLSAFLRTHSGQILAAWDEFASTVTHAGQPLDAEALRDHAAQILADIGNDLARPQSPDQQRAKSRGEALRNPAHGDSAAETHADARLHDGFSVEAMITEYRALRASVLSLWAAANAQGVAAQDLDEITRFNEAMDQALAESVSRYTRRVDASADLFLGVLGHDIRNPLGTIRMSVDLLVRSGQLTPSAARPLVNSVARVQGLIDLMVDYSRAQSAAVMPLARRQGNLDQQFRNLIAESSVRHGDRRLDLDANGDFSGEWDEARMGQLLSNLLENAALYGARARPITVRMRALPLEVSFVVHNEGAIIPADDHERIFEPRKRLDAQEQRAPQGLGLGLYICREIARAHGGAISVTSRDGEGTSFVVTLPRQARAVVDTTAAQLS